MGSPRSMLTMSTPRQAPSNCVEDGRDAVVCVGRAGEVVEGSGFPVGWWGGARRGTGGRAAASTQPSLPPYLPPTRSPAHLSPPTLPPAHPHALSPHSGRARGGERRERGIHRQPAVLNEVAADHKAGTVEPWRARGRAGGRGSACVRGCEREDKIREIKS